MNKLEEFIKANREEFDNKQPREKLWSSIESEMAQNQQDYSWLWKAASVVLLAVCSFLIWERSTQQIEESPLATEPRVDLEFVETELYYTQLIAKQLRAVDQFDLNDPEIKENFKRDLASLDTMYQQLKIEYVETSNEAVVEAMIGNLQLRMELLNEQLLILEQIENDYNNDTHEVEHL
ncbi:MAG: hypothetical protein DHS20C17_08420 [Cyclobacteriaceae bacterium]|nr:MAG: hypothetical protein DHS20C17_08420 [Cyclobacteriaceae bacterium]